MPLKIKVLKADLETKTIDYVLAGEPVQK